jgi:hypothetical protein
MHGLDTAIGYISLTLLPVDLPDYLIPPTGDIEVPELSLEYQQSSDKLDDIFK